MTPSQDDFFVATNLSKLIQDITPVLELVLLVAVVILVSERVFGLNIKGAVDNAERLMADAAQGNGRGNPWPLVALILGGFFALVWLVRGL